MNWCGKLLFGFVAAIAAATAAPVAANNSDLASETVAACQSMADLATLTDAVTKIGWTVSLPADLDDRAMRSFAATFLRYQLGFGEIPDTRIVSRWEQAQKYAAGARKLKQIEGTKNLDRWFVRDQTGSILRVRIVEHEIHHEVNCVIALKVEDSPYTFQQLIGDSGRDPQKLPPVYYLRPQSSKSGGLKRTLNGTILNTERISAVSGSDIDVSVVYSTHTSKQPEKSE